MKAALRNIPIPLLLLLLAVSPTAGATGWTTQINCEGGTPGTRVPQGGADEFTQAFTNTLYSNTVTGTGDESCQMGIAAGADGWGSWGGTYTFPTHLSVGSELWIRLSLYVPVGFNYTGNPMLKFMRVHTSSPTVTNQGYLDLYINPPTGTVWDFATKASVTDPFTFYYEGKPISHAIGSRPQNSIAPGKWETYEVYYRLDTVSKDNGGTGEVRIWKNNQLLADLTDQVTLVDSTTYAESFFLFTYWNGLAPATQHLYVDDITITDQTPANRDTNGNPCICAPNMAPSPTPPRTVAVQ